MKLIMVYCILVVSLLNGKTFNVSNSNELRELLTNLKTTTEDNIIRLKPGIYKTNGNPFLYTGKFDLRVFGDESPFSNKQIILDGENKSSIFNILGVYNKNKDEWDAPNVYFGDLYFRNGNSIKNGGTISSNGNINIFNSIIKNSYSKLNGGAIYSDKQINIYDTVIIENTFAEQIGGALYSQGDAILSGDIRLSQETKFINNKAGVRANIAYTNRGISPYKTSYNDVLTEHENFVSVSQMSSDYIYQKTNVADYLLAQQYKIESGSIRALHELGKSYLYDDGNKYFYFTNQINKLSPNSSLAYNYLSEAANEGYLESSQFLGFLFYFGLGGFQKNSHESLKWFNLSKEYDDGIFYDMAQCARLDLELTSNKSFENRRQLLFELKTLITNRQNLSPFCKDVGMYYKIW